MKSTIVALMIVSVMLCSGCSCTTTVLVNNNDIKVERVKGDLRVTDKKTDKIYLYNKKMRRKATGKVLGVEKSENLEITPINNGLLVETDTEKYFFR